MKYFKLVFAVVVWSFAFHLHAQQDPKAETQRLLKLSQKLEGTYQVQIIDSRELPAIPLSMMDSIAAKRDQTQPVYFWLKKNTRVKVLPYSDINKSGFSPLIRVVHVSSKDLNK